MNSSTLIQGGRLRKTNRGIISFAPFLAGASMLALGALLATTSPTEAGTCDVAIPSTNPTRICMNAAMAGDDAVSFHLGHDGLTDRPRAVTFTDTNSNGQVNDFGLNVTDDGGFLIKGVDSSVGVSIVLSGTGDIIAGGTDNAPAAGQFTQNGDAIFVENAGTGAITINVKSNLRSMHGSGVQIRSVNASLTTAVNTFVTVNGNIGASGANEANSVGKDGIYIFQNKGGSATVQVTGDIWAGRIGNPGDTACNPSGGGFTLDRQGETGNCRMGRGIYIRQDHASGQHAQVTIKKGSGSSGSIRSRGSGIIVENSGIGDTWVKALNGDVNSFESGHGIYAKTSFAATGKTYIAAKTVIANSGRAVELFHRGSGAGRVAITGSALSRGMKTDAMGTVTVTGAEGIFITGFADRGGEMLMDARATHLSVKVGNEERRVGGAPGADRVDSLKDGIVIDHQGGTAATADIRSYVPIISTNSMSGVDATGIKITMGTNTGTASIVQEDGTGTMTPTTTEITGVTVRVLAREEINAKTRGIDINQQGEGAIRIESSCSVDTATTVDSCITTADEEGIRVQTAAKTTGSVDITVGGEQDRGANTGSNKAIKSGDEGINVIHAGSGMLTIAANGEIESGEEGIEISHAGSGATMITANAGIESGDEGIEIIHDGSGAMMITASAEIESGDEGISVHNNYVSDTDTGDGTTGNIDITVGGETAGTSRAITSGTHGIFLHQVGSGHANITVNGGIETTMGHGIQINRDDGEGSATIVVNADITARGTSGSNNGRSGIEIHFIHAPSSSKTTEGDVSVTIAEGVTVTGDHAPGMDIGNFGSGSVLVDVNGTIRRTGDAGIVLSLGNGASGDLRLILRDGAVVEDGRSTSNRDIEVLGTASATLELTGTREDKTLDLGDISGFNNLEKTGSGTWTLTGAQDPENNSSSSNLTLSELTVSEGTLVLDLDSPDGSETPVLEFSGTVAMPPMLSIAQGASLEINGDNISTSVSLRNADETISTSEGVNLALGGGNLHLSGADGRIDIGELTADAGASVTIDVEFPEVMEEMDGAAGMEEDEEEEGVVLTDARLNPRSVEVAAEGIAVSIMHIGGTPTTIGNFIRVEETAPLGEGTFVADNIIDSPIQFTLEHEEADDGANVWNLIAEMAAAGAGGRGTIHDAFTGTLSELSQLETLHERLRDRQAKYGTNSWVKAYSANTQLTPSEGANFDIENAGFQIGLRAPLENIFEQRWAKGASFDTSLEFGRAFTDAFVQAGMVEIQSEVFALGLGTTYNFDKFYIDGQLKYSYFENNLDAQNMRLASPSADSLAASIEFGRVVGGGISFDEIIGGTDAPGDYGIPDFKLVPSLQVSWSSVDFDPYTSTTGIPVKLDDGDVFFGRVGVLAQGEWDDVRFIYEGFSVADVRLRGHANIVMPLDAEVVTHVMGMPISSKRVDPSLDAGVSIAYEWDDAYILHAGLSTQQGEEVEGYSGTIGFKHEF